MSKVRRALEFATHAHKGQKRKYDGRPYITHPVDVKASVSFYGGSKTAKVVALLHDVVEDTEYTEYEIQVIFGHRVSRCVSALTHPPKAVGNRATRNIKYNTNLVWADWDIRNIVHLVKACDILHNLPSIMEYDPDFGEVYIQEKLDQAKVLVEIPWTTKVDLTKMFKRYGYEFSEATTYQQYIGDK